MIAERLHFYCRDQRPGETVAEYVAELRRLAITCAFGTHLNEALRDRIVCGVKSEVTQKCLLSEREPTLAKVVDVTQTMEAADKGATGLKSEPAPVDKASTPSAPAKKPCYRCGQKGHHPRLCAARDGTCHNCGKKGHFARVCRQGKQFKGGTQWVGGDHTQAEDDEGEDLLRVGGTASQPYEVQIEINGKKVRMEVDTGASVSLISQSTQQSLFPTAILQHSNIKLRSYTRHSIPVIGMMKV